VKCNALLSELRIKYEANAAKIRRGTTITVAGAFGAGAAIGISGGSALPAAIAPLVQSLLLAEAINGATELESAYETVINKMKSQIQTTNTAIAAYNKAYDAYVMVLVAHNTSPSHSISPSGKHPQGPRMSWDTNFPLPFFPCASTCDMPFSTPTEARESHRVKCALPWMSMSCNEKSWRYLLASENDPDICSAAGVGVHFVGIREGFCDEDAVAAFTGWGSMCFDFCQPFRG